MNESLFHLIAQWSIQAGFMAAVPFAGLVYEYKTQKWLVYYVGKETLVLPVDIATHPDALLAITNQVKKLKGVDLGSNTVA